MRTPRSLLALVALSGVAADFTDADPAVFPAGDPRAKDLPKMLATDVEKRMWEAGARESKAFAAVHTRGQWEAFRDARIRSLRESLGTFLPAPADIRVVVTRTLDGDGYRVENLVYESRPGLWVSANLYLPAEPGAKTPGVLISHSHHTAKTNGELQDMGMTWARSGVAVLVPDHLGHGERRQHDFTTDKDYPKPFRASRQDYYFRYNSNLQLSAAGESLMGWMAWDLMRGVDVLLKQRGIDRDRIILLGAVAGGGDPAGVAAALDPRVACVIPFNFGGWQPESTATADPDRDFAWFGEGYWESTRGLRGGAAGGFAHWVIAGSVAPRKVVYAHEFAWPEASDPAWPRLRKVFDFYGEKDNLRVAHGTGSLKGQPPESSHCTHVGAVHRKMIYPALKDWFGMPIPAEYSRRRPADELTCWTAAAKQELQPKKLHEVVGKLADERTAAVRQKVALLTPAEKRAWYRDEWVRLLGPLDPCLNPKLIEGRAEDVPGGTLARFALEVEPGIVVPFLLLTPAGAKPGAPAVVMVAQAGKAAFLEGRADAVAAFLKAGVVVCLVDVRGTGETRAGASASRGSSRTSIAQTNLILGTPLLGGQIRDLRTVARWLRGRHKVAAGDVAFWGDSFAPTNPAGQELAAPHDAPDAPAVAEPLGPILAGFAGFLENPGVVYTRGGWNATRTIFDSPYSYLPHEIVVPGCAAAGGFPDGGKVVRHEGAIDARNRPVGEKPAAPAEVAAWVVKALNEK